MNKRSAFIMILLVGVLVGCKGGEEASTNVPDVAASAPAGAKSDGRGAPQGMKDSDLTVPGGATRQFGSKSGN